jgi:glutathione S-transferase
MITLYSFGPMFGLPDASPFVTKAEMLLKLSGLPFAKDSGALGKAPKGKLPYIQDEGRIVADSSFIRLHLERQHGIDFDKGLSPRDRGIAWAIEKMLEDHLYWVMLNYRWLDDTNFERGPAHFFDRVPAPVRGLAKRMVRGKIRKSMHAHGMGRHSPEEIDQLGDRAIGALAATLGDQPYLMGATRCGADATVYAFVLGTLCPHFESPLRTMAERHANLVAYCKRLTLEFYPQQPEKQFAA